MSPMKICSKFSKIQSSIIIDQIRTLYLHYILYKFKFFFLHDKHNRSEKLQKDFLVYTLVYYYHHIKLKHNIRTRIIDIALCAGTYV